MINEKYRAVVFAFFMALFMSGFMSLVISIFNIGLATNIINIWLKAWVFAFCVAFPSVVMVAPLVHRITCKVIKA